MKTITQEWLDYAKTDLLACENLITNDFLTNIVAFHSQQVVEKCFKAIIEENGLKVPRIHSLIRLLKIIENNIDFTVNEEMLKVTDIVYTKSRYPGELGLLPDDKPSLELAKQLYEFAKDIYHKAIQMDN